ncbi:hypothetical protein MHYP_G00350740 [Metynnis hypsauchen]
MSTSLESLYASAPRSFTTSSVFSSNHSGCGPPPLMNTTQRNDADPLGGARLVWCSCRFKLRVSLSACGAAGASLAVLQPARFVPVEAP